MFQTEKIVFDEIQERLEVFMAKVVKDIQNELVAQGHVATGRLKNSIVYEIERKPNIVEALIYMEDYGQAIDTGVPASSVPYSGNGGGGKSDYIQGLFDFFRQKGLDEDDALGAAFATAKKASSAFGNEGHPTKGSFAFSNNGKRTGFLTDTLDGLTTEIDDFYESLGENVILQAWNNVLTRFQGQVEPIIIRA